MSDFAVIKKLWPEIREYQFVREHYARFLKYLKTSCAAVTPATAPFATTTPDATVELITVIRRSHASNQSTNQLTSAVMADLQQNQVQGLRPLTPDNVTKSICLGFKLWLSLETSKWPSEWGNRTVPAIINSKLPSKSTKPVPGNSASVDPRLTMEYLSSFHGFRVFFTDNLAQHLDIHWQGSRSQRPIIYIYKHKIFLWNELRFTTRSLLPKDFVEETLDTLNLLFPSNDYHTSKLLESYDLTDFYELGPCERPRRRDLRMYSYWREKIVALSEAVQQPPVGFQQLKPDRDGRNIMTFLNFWVAMLVALFTIVSIAFGAASIALAKYSLDLSDKQYRLSLAQACAAPDATYELPGYC
jgi:hypothetical protein